MNCGTCVFLFKSDDQEGGECRRYPPIPVVEVQAGSSDGWTIVWPDMNDDEWCGEYEEVPGDE